MSPAILLVIAFGVGGLVTLLVLLTWLLGWPDSPSKPGLPCAACGYPGFPMLRWGGGKVERLCPACKRVWKPSQGG